MTRIQRSGAWWTGLLFAAATLGAAERVMVGDDIYVGPDESLEAAVCVLCSIHNEGSVGDAAAILGGLRNEGEIRGDAVALLGGAKNQGVIRGDLAAILGGAESTGEVGGDAVAILGGLRSRGPIGGDAVAVLGGLHTSGTVGGDAVAVLGGVELEDGAEVGGETVAVLGGVHGGPGRVIGGRWGDAAGLRKAAGAAFVIALLLLLVLGLLLWPFVAFVTASILGEQRLATVAATLDQRLGMSLLAGLAVFFGSFVASILVSIALFWLPSAELIVFLAFFATAATGYAGLSLWIGRGLARTAAPTGATVLGAALVTVLQLIPVVGWFLFFPAFLLSALGAATVSGFGTSVDWMAPRGQGDPIPKPLLD